LRELVTASVARATAEWWHTANILAAMAAMATGKKQDPRDFHPLAGRRKRGGMTRAEFMAMAPPRSEWQTRKADK